MREFLKQSWKYIVPLIIGFVIGILINLPACNKPESKIEYIPVHDTLTFTHDSIIYKTKIVYKTKLDTFYVNENNDTVVTPDLPIEHKEYRDTIKTDSTQARVMIKYHGFAADVDTVSFIYDYFNKKETIIQPPKKIGLVWCIGPYIGFGCGINIPTGTFGYGPSAGICGSIGIGGIIK